MQVAEPFASWFERATGRRPYRYQQALAEAAEPPSVLRLPTGSGKTQAVLGAWLYQRRRGLAPRRLVYALPMRSLVEQTARVAEAMREALELSREELAIHVLMGGEEAVEGDWRRRPEDDQIVVGTIDMLLSRALNRGYAESRFAWPVSFGLLNSDCRWVFDEVQLMGPARATSAQLDGLRRRLGTGLPCETLWVSATVDRQALETVDRPALGRVTGLEQADWKGALAGRLNASKTLERAAVAERAGDGLARRAAALALERHVAGTRTLVVLNTVAAAQAAYEGLGRLTDGGEGPETVLVHSRFRPPERARHMDAAMAEPGAAGTIVVATQVVEAGVDLSARSLVTALAPFSSMVQRLGRCNRAGEFDDAKALWLDDGPIAGDEVAGHAVGPYPPVDLEASRATLLELEGCSVSPASLERLDAVAEQADDSAVLRRQDLLDLFDTSPDLSGTDIDVAPFIRDDDERTVSVFFRMPRRDRASVAAGEPLPTRDELVQVPRAELAGRTYWTADHVDGGWTSWKNGIPCPGATVMLDARDGGYDPEIGWRPGLDAHVRPLARKVERATESYADRDAEHAAQELGAHLAAVAVEAAAIAVAVDVPEWLEPLSAAAALHDVGKAHPAFQDALLRAMGDDPTAGERLWAKSRGGRPARPYLRHELASALAVRAANGALDVPDLPLVAYLIAAHHGRVRLTIRPAPGERRPAGVPEDARFALGLADGDELPAVETPLGTVPAVSLDLSAMELGDERSWTEAAAALRDDPELGPFRLGFLEALLRMADWRASA